MIKIFVLIIKVLIVIVGLINACYDYLSICRQHNRAQRRYVFRRTGCGLACTKIRHFPIYNEQNSPENV